MPEIKDQGSRLKQNSVNKKADGLKRKKDLEELLDKKKNEVLDSYKIKSML